MEPVDMTVVEEFVLEAEPLGELEEFLRGRGREGVEAFAMLGGRPLGPETFLVDFVFVPAQKASMAHVSLEPDSLIEIHERLPELGRMFAIQVHTHPGAAGHTSVDDEDTTLTQPGTLSIVVPDFCEAGLHGWPGCAVYRRVPGGWTPRMTEKDVEELFTFKR